MSEMEIDIMQRAVKFCVGRLGMIESECWKYPENTCTVFWRHYLESDQDL